MLYQAGRILARTSEGTGNIDSVLHVFKPVSFTLASEVTEITAEGFPYDVGPAQILDSAISREEFTLTIPQTSVDELDLEMFLDERAATNASISLPTDEKITIPASGPYTVTVSGLATSSTDQDVVATILSDTAPLRLKRILNANAASIATGEFAVGASKVVTFHSAQAGLSAVLSYFKTYSNLKMQGGTNPRKQFGTMSFSAVLKGTRTTKRLYIPRISRISGANLGVSGEANETEVQYKCTAPAGWSLPFAIWTEPA